MVYMCYVALTETEISHVAIDIFFFTDQCVGCWIILSWILQVQKITERKPLGVETETSCNSNYY